MHLPFGWGQRHFARVSYVCWYTLLFAFIFSSSSSFVSCKYLHALSFCRVQHFTCIPTQCYLVHVSRKWQEWNLYRKCIQIQTPSISTIRETVQTVKHKTLATRYIAQDENEKIFAEIRSEAPKKWRGIICCNIKWNQLKLYIMKIIMRSTWLEWTMSVEWHVERPTQKINFALCNIENYSCYCCRLLSA